MAHEEVDGDDGDVGLEPAGEDVRDDVVEGHELEVMRAWPFKHGKWCVSLFTIENNHWCNATQGILPVLRTLLPDYEHVRSVGVDEVFKRKVPCATGLKLKSNGGRIFGGLG